MHLENYKRIWRRWINWFFVCEKELTAI